ncbi:type I polyketide synthase, partial [Dactylosporangium sucinum]|uniref:type I polyketide synthase n=1 Tax=Dactylosporangium sucinum TaxID=1424081 RepID=UPI00167ED137
MDVSPDGVLTSMIALTAPDAVVVPTLRPGDRLLSAAAGLHAAGVDVDWSAVLGGGGAVDLPTYAFEHTRYWIDPPAGAVVEAAVSDSRFWDAVGRADAGELADVLGLDAAERPALEGLVPALARWRDREWAAGRRYDVTWQPARPGAAATLSGRWLVVTGPGVPAGLTETVRAGLTARGADAVVVDGIPAGLAGWESADGVVSLLGCAEQAAPGGLAAGLEATVRLLQSAPPGRLWALTRGAAPVAGGAPTDPWAWQLRGLGRVAALEYPRLWGGLIDLPSTVDAAALDRLAAILAGDGVEDQVAIRAGAVWVPRLTRLTGSEPERAWTARGTVVVTGASGALGARVARWAAQAGATRLVLASRQGDAAGNAAELAADLAAAGAEAVFVRCDLADPAQVPGLLDAAGDDLTAVFHLAGVGRIGPLATADPGEWPGHMAAKVAGAWALDRALGDRPLDAFVVFSSISGIWGSGGHGSYAAANAFLDGLAVARRERGLAGTAVAWGPWAGGGMAAGDSDGYLARLGLAALDPDTALTVLGQAIAAGRPTTTVADVDWAVFAPTFTLARPCPLLHELPEAGDPTGGAAADPAGADRSLTAQLAGLDEAGQRRLLLGLVRSQVAAVLGHSSGDAVPAGQAFSELGFDSIMAVELRNALAKATGLSLPATLIFDHPTPADLAELLRERAGGTARAAVVVHAAAAADEPMAIVGMACRYPGGIASPDDLWDLVARGGDGVGPFPADRGWLSRGLLGADWLERYRPEGGFLPDAAGFDAAFFGISPREALAMDPQQRLLLEVTWEALEHAGLDPAGLRGSRSGVFVGASAPDYTVLTGANPAAVEGYALTGNVSSVLSGRIAYTLGLTGPAVTIDTACSSSLVALHLAAQALRSGECTLALAGGVTVMATPAGFVEFARQGGLSGDGRCKSYAGSADGTGWAEGVGVLVVERLSDARANGHRILGVVRGSAVNQDGASNGLTAPNGPSQERVILQALANAGVTAGEVDVVEGHGTGTRLGDPIEAQALLATYGQDRQEPLWLGSVKSNIGHTQAAAGVAGIIKVVQAMRHATMPATLHVDEPSPQVDWSAGRVSLLTESRPWPNGRPRRAGVSSFGISGTNAHVIIEEGDPTPV